MFPDRWGSDRDYEAAMGTHAGPSTVSRGRALSSAEATARLHDVMARLRARHPEMFKVQADDPEGLAERRWSQR
jgi:hypothetical protein